MEGVECYRRYPPPVQREQQRHYQQNRQEQAYLLILEQHKVLAVHFPHKQEERQAAEHHKEGCFHKDQVVELAHGHVGGGEATGSDTGQTVVERIKQAHTG